LGATKTRLPLLLLLVVAAALTAAAGLMLFSTFKYYDDEGYVLLSLRNFVEHGHLYGGVYTQYGPFPYVLAYALHQLGLPLAHTAGRLLTLAYWGAAATLAAWLVGRTTRHTVAMLAVLSAVFVYLWVMTSEPGHPGGLIALITALMAVLGCRALVAGNWSAWAGVAGAGCAALLLTKVNIGGLAALSTLSLLLLHPRHERWRRATFWLITGGLALLPFLLMRPLLNTPWVQTYAAVFALAAIPVAGTLSLATGFPGEGRPWRTAALAGGGVALAVLGVILARGTSPAELWQGVVLGPLQHPGHFNLVFPWPPSAGVVIAVAVGSLGLFLVALAVVCFAPSRRGGVDSVVAGLRLLAATGLALAIGQFPAMSPDHLVFAYSVPCLWFFLWPLTGEEPAAILARSWLGLLFLGQWLHAFPVPGSQVAWGTFLAIPLGAIGAAQAAAWLGDRHRAVLTVARTRVLRFGVTLVLAVMAVVPAARLGEIGRSYFYNRALDLPGAGALRLPDNSTSLYQLLAVNAGAHSDLLFSLPGMYSFNLWTGLPTPTLANVTHWFSLLDAPRQQAIIQALEQHPRACVIVQTDHLDFLRDRHLAPAGPLYDYVMGQFETAFEIDGFQFRVHRGRHVAPLLTAEVFVPRVARPARGARDDTLVKFLLVLPAGRAVGSVEIATMEERGGPTLRLDRSNARLEFTPVDLTGSARGPTVAGAFPFQPSGPVEVALYFDRGGRGFSVARTFLVVRDLAGAELALVRLRP
jgi:hypothetical protein